MRGPVELKLKKGHYLSSSYRKRKEGFKKKAMELATLCNVPVLVLCYGPTGTLDTVPSGKQDVVDIIARFRGLTHEDQNKYKEDLESYLLDKMTKKGGKLNRQITSEIKQLADSKLEAVRKRMQFLADESQKEDQNSTMSLSRRNGKQIAAADSLPQNGGFYYVPMWFPGTYPPPTDQSYGTPLSYACMPPMVTQQPPMDFRQLPMYYPNPSVSSATAYLGQKMMGGEGEVQTDHNTNLTFGDDGVEASDNRTIDSNVKMGGGGEVQTVNTDLVLNLEEGNSDKHIASRSEANP